MLSAPCSPSPLTPSFEAMVLGAMAPEVTKAMLGGRKLALTACAAVMVTMQVPVPVQSPPHPPKKKPLPGCGVRVTTVFQANGCEQLAIEQLMSVGVELTVPVAAPLKTLVSVSVCVDGTKVAVTILATSMVTVHMAFMPQALIDQPLKMELPSAAA